MAQVTSKAKTKAKAKSKIKPLPKDPKVAKSNIAKQCNVYWTINTIYNDRHPDGIGMSFEEANRRIASAQEKLGPHRKVLKRLNNLQHQLIFGVSSCPRKSKSKCRNQATILALIPRT